MFLGATLAVLSRSDDYCALFQPCVLTTKPPHDARLWRRGRLKALTAAACRKAGDQGGRKRPQIPAEWVRRIFQPDAKFAARSRVETALSRETGVPLARRVRRPINASFDDKLPGDLARFVTGRGLSLSRREHSDCLAARHAAGVFPALSAPNECRRIGPATATIGLGNCASRRQRGQVQGC